MMFALGKLLIILKFIFPRLHVADLPLSALVDYWIFHVTALPNHRVDFVPNSETSQAFGMHILSLVQDFLCRQAEGDRLQVGVLAVEEGEPEEVCVRRRTGGGAEAPVGEARGAAEDALRSDEGEDRLQVVVVQGGFVRVVADLREVRRHDGEWWLTVEMGYPTRGGGCTEEWSRGLGEGTAEVPRRARGATCFSRGAPRAPLAARRPAQLVRHAETLRDELPGLHVLVEVDLDALDLEVAAREPRVVGARRGVPARVHVHELRAAGVRGDVDELVAGRLQRLEADGLRLPEDVADALHGRVQRRLLRDGGAQRLEAVAVQGVDAERGHELGALEVLVHVERAAQVEAPAHGGAGDGVVPGAQLHDGVLSLLARGRELEVALQAVLLQHGRLGAHDVGEVAREVLPPDGIRLPRAVQGHVERARLVRGADRVALPPLAVRDVLEGEVPLGEGLGI
eukprot:3941071-Rhodomonas_salina.2